MCYLKLPFTILGVIKCCFSHSAQNVIAAPRVMFLFSGKPSACLHLGDMAHAIEGWKTLRPISWEFCASDNPIGDPKPGQSNGMHSSSTTSF